MGPRLRTATGPGACFSGWCPPGHPLNAPAMICILSEASLEHTTEAVVDWLELWQIPLNAEDISAGGVSMCMQRLGNALSCRAGTVELDPEKITVVWLRRWGYYLKTAFGREPFFRDHAEGSGKTTR
jgi:hypothetical protein